MIGKFRELPSPANGAASAPFMIVSVVARRGMDPVSEDWPIEVLSEGSLRPLHAAAMITDVPWHADGISPSFLIFLLYFLFLFTWCLVTRPGTMGLGPCIPPEWPPCSFLYL